MVKELSNGIWQTVAVHRDDSCIRARLSECLDYWMESGLINATPNTRIGKPDFHKDEPWWVPQSQFHRRFQGVWEGYRPAYGLKQIRNALSNRQTIFHDQDVFWATAAEPRKTFGLRCGGGSSPRTLLELSLLIDQKSIESRDLLVSEFVERVNG